jgi:ADP-ribose pyrophosphatase
MKTIDHSSHAAHLVETKVDGEAVFDGKLLHVRRDTVRLPDGTLATREYIVHPGAVLIIPVLPDGSLVIVRQFRYPLDRVLIEFPAGKLDPGEAPLATAERELREEAGYVAASWQRLGRVHSVVSYSTEEIELLVADDLTHVGAELDAGEFLEVGTMSVEEMLAALDRDEITDAKTVAALLLYVRRLRAPAHDQRPGAGRRVPLCACRRSASAKSPWLGQKPPRRQRRGHRRGTGGRCRGRDRMGPPRAAGGARDTGSGRAGGDRCRRIRNRQVGVSGACGL